MTETRPGLIRAVVGRASEPRRVGRRVPVVRRLRRRLLLGAHAVCARPFPQSHDTTACSNRAVTVCEGRWNKVADGIDCVWAREKGKERTEGRMVRVGAAHCQGRKRPKGVVKRPPHPYKRATHKSIHYGEHQGCMNAPGGPGQGQELAEVLSYSILPMLSAPSRQDHVPPMPIGHQRWSAQAEIRQKESLGARHTHTKATYRTWLQYMGKAKVV